MIRKLGWLLILIILIDWSSRIGPVYAQQDGLTPVFILLSEATEANQPWAQVQHLIEVEGGQVLHRFPQQALIAHVPDHLTTQLARTAGVIATFTGPVELATVDSYGSQARLWAGVWNNLITPETTLHRTEGLTFEENHDAFVAPDLPAAGQLTAAAAVTPGYYQTSEYMAGSVAVGLILVESTGAIDPSTENWSSDEKQLVFNKVVAALNWWATLDPRAQLSFVYDNHTANPFPTGVEPINRPYADQQYWIADAMGALGYTAPSYFTRVRDYNNQLRSRYQTDWAFTIFVVDSSADSDNRFSDGMFAYAYLGGPFLVMTYGNNGYGPSYMDAVAAHEIGHIFNALDQYASANQGCDHRAGYLHIENQNSQLGTCLSDQPSIMRGQIYPYQINALDPYAAGQLGWRDSDGDNILDPLDTALPITIDTFSQQDYQFSGSGVAQIIPYLSPSRPSITINRLAGVQYRLAPGEWQAAQADDGLFNETTEAYRFTFNLPSPGRHTLEVAARDSAGNTSAIYAVRTIEILDPVDGGLNTELYPVDALAFNSPVELRGEAYDLNGTAVAGVEYRLNGGAWQSAVATDGAFDSTDEAFTIPFHTPDKGPHLFEARAISSSGQVEVNYAYQQIEVSEQLYNLFMPLVIK